MRLVIRASPAVSEAISACSTPHFTCVMVTGLEAAFKAFADGARALIVEAGAPDVATFVADCRARCTGLVVIAATAQPVNDALADLVDEVISVPVHPAELKLRLRTLARLTGLGGGGGPTGSHSASLAQITDARALWAALKLIADR